MRTLHTSVSLLIAMTSSPLLGCKSDTKDATATPPPLLVTYDAPHCSDPTQQRVDHLCQLGTKYTEAMQCSQPQGRTKSGTSYYQWLSCTSYGQELSAYQWSEQGNAKAALPDEPIRAIALDIWESAKSDEAPPTLASLAAEAVSSGCQKLAAPAPTDEAVFLQCGNILVQFSKSPNYVILKAGSEHWFSTYFDATGRENPPKLMSR